MYLEIVSPEAILFSGEVTSIAVPVVSLLKAGHIKIYGDVTIEEDVVDKFTKQDKGTWLAINSGTLEMKDNKVVVLAD